MTSIRFSFQGHGEIVQPDNSSNWLQLQRRPLEQMDDPKHYNVKDDPGLIAAVNTALTLGMPLLLTGRPGAGKTQLGFRIAYEMGCRPIFFPVKSSSEAQDLFYHIDHLRRLHAAQIKQYSQGSADPADKTDQKDDPTNVRKFIRFQGLGLAILRAMPEERLRDLELWQHAWPDDEKHLSNHGKRQPSLVLIDEIDKAPMDFSNDILEEIRRLQFWVPELCNDPLSIHDDPQKPQKDEKLFRPQVVITSNSEKGLPEAFLRRCVYYHMSAPGKDALRAIVENRLLQQDALRISLSEAWRNRSLDFYLYLRDDCGLEKPPSTAELLNWLLSLDECRDRLAGEDGNEVWRQRAKHCLLKNQQDQERFKQLCDAWKP